MADSASTTIPGPRADEDPPTPATMPRWLWVAYPLANASLAAVLGAVLQVLLGRQVADFGYDDRASAGVLGVVVSVGAGLALIAAPVLGTLSDRTRIRVLGRRNVWILGCGVAGAAALLTTGFAPNALVLGIVWAVALWPVNGYSAAMTTVLPERVPARLRGTMSGIAGTGGLLGTFAGVAVAGLSPDPLVGFTIVAAQFLVVSVLFAFTTKDETTAPAATSMPVKAALPTFRTQPDFWWTFIGRFLTFFGYFLVAGMLLYVLRDYVGVGDGSTDDASAAIVQVSGVSTVFLMIASTVGGILADRLGRLKPFVVVSSLLFVPAALVAMAVPTYTGIFVAMSIAGTAFGSYLAVDQALMSRVIADLDAAGRDLGLFSVANGAPQIITPVLAGAVISAFGYPPLFLLMIFFSVAGAGAILLVKGVR